MKKIKTLIRTSPHYPHQGIMFRDITTLLKDPIGLKSTVDQLAKRYKGKPISKVAGIESRGFIIGAPVAYLLGVGFVWSSAASSSTCPTWPQAPGEEGHEGLRAV